MSKPAIIVDIEEQVSSFGDTMTGNLVLGSSSQSLIPTSGILVHDLRDCTIAPHSFGDRLVNFYFDQSGTNGDWKGIIHMHGWTTSGYASWEIAGDAGEYIPAPEDFCIRSGVDGAWNPWRKILHSGNYASYALPLTGGTLTGNIVIQKNTYPNIVFKSIDVGRDSFIQPDSTGVLELANRKNNDNSNKNALLVNHETVTNENLLLLKKTINGSATTYKVFHEGNPPLQSSGYKTYDITVGGDLNTWYPVAIDASFSGNTRLLKIFVSKTLGTQSPAWEGNHSGGTSSLMAGWEIRNNGWDGNGGVVFPLFEPEQGYAVLLAAAEYRGSAAHHLVVYLRGGSATYKITTNYIPNSINVYLTSTNIGTSTHPQNIAPITDIGNKGMIYTKPAYLPITGGTVKGNITANAVYGAVWNDYAEYRQTIKNIKPGMVVIEQGDGSMKPSTDRLQPGGNIVSDTFGFAIGETDECKTPLAVSGRALAYPAEDRYSYEPGDAVGTGPNGTVSKMTREEIMMYPERIIGTVSEIPEYERWGTGNVLVDGRIWIKVR